MFVVGYLLSGELNITIIALPYMTRARIPRKPASNLHKNCTLRRVICCIISDLAAAKAQQSGSVI
jgi:hypothetical protein